MNRLIKITKLKPTAAPQCATPLQENYIPGEDNGNVSVPVDYNIEGNISRPITVGERVFVIRKKRNGISVTGIFETSTVTSVTQDTFTTQNSVYKYEYFN